MRKKLLITFLVVFAALCCAVGFSACDMSEELPVEEEQGSIIEHTHDYTEAVEFPPTCTEQGYTIHYCSCGDSYIDSYVDALGHTEVIDEGFEATCTQTGLTEGKHCSVCDTALIVQTVIPAHGHTEVIDEGVEATCTQTGLTEGKHCSVCDTTLIEQTVIPANGHDWDILEMSFEGHSAVCKVCSEEVTDVHDWHDNECTLCAYSVDGTKGMEYALSADGTYYSLIGIGTCTETDIIIPEIYNGLPVKEIGGYAFQKNTDITSVVIADSIEILKGYAFEGCTALESLTIGKGVKSLIYYPVGGGSLGWNFYGCTALTEINYNAIECNDTDNYNFGNAGADADGITVNIGAEVKKLPDKLFYGTVGFVVSWENRYYVYYAKITKVNFAEDSVLTEIGAQAFAYNIYLEEIELPSTITTMGIGVFNDCTNLAKVTLPEGLTKIERDTFSGCSALTEISLLTDVNVIGENAFKGSGLVEFEIPTSVTEIGKYAFANSSLSAIQLDENIEKIYDYAFAECGLLKTVNYNIPNINEISTDAFNNTGSPDGLTLVIGENVQLIPDCLFYGNENLAEIKLDTAVNLNKIGRSAFANCSGLTSITIPSTITEISNNAFDGCTGLENIYFNATEIEEYDYNVFNAAGTDGKGITFNVGANVKYIPANLCKGVNEFFTVPKIVRVVFEDGSICTTINSYAFYNCDAITEIILPESLNIIDYNAFEGCTAIQNAVIPAAALNAIPYENLKTLTILCGEIPQNAFIGFVNLKDVTLSQNVTAIGSSAFILEEHKMPEERNQVENLYYQGDLSGWCSIEFGNYVNIFGYVDNIYIDGETIEEELIIPSGVEKISGYAFYGCMEIKSVQLPETLEVIEEGAFYYCENIESVTLCEGLTEIGNMAFMSCTQLSDIEIPNSVQTLGYSVFSCCEKLSEITIPNGVTEIGNGAFSYCYSLEKIGMPSMIESIGRGAFMYCTNLSSVSLGPDLTSIGDMAFENCTSISFILVRDAVKYLGSDAFKNCYAITIYCVVAQKPSNWSTGWDGGFPVIWGCTKYNFNANYYDYYSIDRITYTMYEGVKYAVHDDGTFSATVVRQPSNLSGEVTIYNTVYLKQFNSSSTWFFKSIEDSAFYNCKDITKITVASDYIAGIGESAFRGCTSLTSITIPQMPISIGRNAFYDTAYYNNESNWENGVLYLENYLIAAKYLDVSGSYEIKPGTIVIADYTFNSCSKLTSITIPDSVKVIGGGAFNYCSGLTSITIPHDVITIGEFAFSYCSGLIIYCEVEGKPSGWNSDWKPSTCPVIFDCKNNDVSTDGYIYVVADGLKYSLKDGDVVLVQQSTAISGNIVIPSSLIYNDITYTITTIREDAFYGCYMVTDIIIPDSVTTIGNSAFRDCRGLTSITIPDSVTSIENSAFYNCSGLTSVTIGNGVTSIGEHAFYNCSGLTSITIPDSVTTIGRCAFSECSGLTSIAIPDSVTSIGDRAFYGCSGLTSITIGNSITLIDRTVFENTAYYNNENNWENGVLYLDNYLIATKNDVVTGNYEIKQGTTLIAINAFFNCSGLTSITIPDSVTLIGDYAFEGCSGLTSITIPNSVTSIGKGALVNCSEMTSVIIGNGISEISDWLFYGCSGISNIVIPDNINKIGENAFYICSGLTSITIPDSVASFGNLAFFGLTELTDIDYGGTIEQWNAIFKSNFWDDNTGKYTVHCSNGDILKENY